MTIKRIKKENHKDILRVAAYCRVSTEHDEQEDSLENQIQYYQDYIRSRPDYEYVDVYSDSGISGFKEERPGFQRIVSDCRAGKIDLILTKSISRFARNTDTTLKVTRELRDMGIGVFFELQGINSISLQGELLLTVYAAFAQAESESISELGKMTYRRKYEAGIPVQYLERSFGYTKDESGAYVIAPEEAKWVREIYHMIADGHTPAAVGRYLNEKGIKTTAGSTWMVSTVIRLVENEIYKGDYIMHKRFVDHNRKLRINHGEVEAWYAKNDHVPIVSRQLWQKAQDALARRRDYLSEGSGVKEMNDENYPYRHSLYCAYCGHPLYPRIYSDGNRLNWGCSGQKRYGKKFCQGVNVPDSTVRGWELDGTAYVYNKNEDKGFMEYGYYHESYWKRDHKKKTAKTPAPALNKKNYPYMNRIFCGKCRSKLTRHCNTNSGRVTWICNEYKHKGKDSCAGIRIFDDDIRKWMPIEADIYITEERREVNGKKCYSYTSKAPD